MIAMINTTDQPFGWQQLAKIFVLCVPYDVITILIVFCGLQVTRP